MAEGELRRKDRLAVLAMGRAAQEPSARRDDRGIREAHHRPEQQKDLPCWDKHGQGEHQRRHDDRSTDHHGPVRQPFQNRG